MTHECWGAEGCGHHRVCVIGGHEVTLRVRHTPGVWAPGSGTRELRRWLQAEPCCARPQLRVRDAPDSRRECASCGLWLSASHSDGLLLLARAGTPVGVDVQVWQRRPAALRWVSEVCGYPGATLREWAVLEAVLKAMGRAGRRPVPGELVLPGTPDWFPSGGGDGRELSAEWVLVGGQRAVARVGVVAGATWCCAVFRPVAAERRGGITAAASTTANVRL